MSRLAAQQAIITRVHEVVAHARSLYPAWSVPMPSIGFKLRGRTVGGTAHAGRNELQFNLDWYNANPTDYIADVIPHEVAHLVATGLFRDRGHGRYWRMVARQLGAEPSRVVEGNTYSGVKRARVKNEYLYLDSAGREQWVGPVHHNRLQTKGGSPDDRYAYRLRMRDSGAKIHKDGFQHRSRTLT